MKRLFIIDAYYHIYRAFTAPIKVNLVSPDGEPTNATYIFITSLFGLIEKQKPDGLVVAMEGRGREFRKDICSEYKATRGCPPDALVIQIQRVEEILTAMNIPVFRVDNYEADDIIGTVAKRAVNNGYDVFICSKDKDFLQLLDCSISMYSMKTGEYITFDDIAKKFGVRPDQFMDYLALQGDSADNIPGIPGIGGKTASKLLQEYGSVENILTNIDGIEGKCGENLRKFFEQLLVNKKLTTICCDVPVNVNYDDLSLKSFDKDKLKAIFSKLGFKKLLEKI